MIEEMFHREKYHIEKEPLIDVLEEIADYCLHPRYRRDLTVVGFVSGKVPPGKRLLTAEGITKNLFTTIGTNEMLIDLTAAAADLLKEGRLHVRSRFMPDLLLRSISPEQEQPLIKAFKAYDPVDDLRWHFALDYLPENNLAVCITPNGNYHLPKTDLLPQIYQVLFGDIIQKHLS